MKPEDIREAREHYELPAHLTRVPGCSFCDEDATEDARDRASWEADGEGPESL